MVMGNKRRKQASLDNAGANTAPSSGQRMEVVMDPTSLATQHTRAKSLHVEAIIVMMRNGQWTRGVSGPEYATKHALNAKTVSGYADEAWRAVSREVTDPAQVTKVIAASLAARLTNADNRDAARLADVWSRVVGARAPERHEVAMVVAEYDRLDMPGKLAWLDERIAALTEARMQLVGDGVVAAGEGECVPVLDGGGESG